MSAFKKVIIVSDCHGDQADPLAVAAFLKFNRLFAADYRILNGDNWDFRPLRRKATEEEKRESMEADYEAGLNFINEFAPTHFNYGNHDWRLVELAQNGSGIMRDYAQHILNDINDVFADLHCQVLPYDKRAILQIGHLKVIHGFGSAATTAARRHCLAYGSVVIGHLHCIQQASVEGIDNRIGRIIGCLCKLDMDYNRAHLGSLMHRHGFAYGWIHTNGDYVLHQAESINGSWLLPTSLLEI